MEIYFRVRVFYRVPFHSTMLKKDKPGTSYFNIYFN